MSEPIDIVMVTFNRVAYTRRSIEYIKARTTTPYRLIVVDNGSDDGTMDYLMQIDLVDDLILGMQNRGIHWAHNAGLAKVQSRYYVSTDNDCLCAKLIPDWLSQLASLLDRHKQFAAISCRPQVMVGSGPDMFHDCGEVKEVSHAGASLRMMRADAVRAAGGWEKKARPGRNHEERWIAARLKERGWSVGYARDVFCWHQFGENWGYMNIPAEAHGHHAIWPPPAAYDKIAVDPITWRPL